MPTIQSLGSTLQQLLRLAAVALILTGCGGDGSSSGGGGTTPTTVSLSGVVDDGAANTPIADASCLFLNDDGDDAGPVISAADGSFALEVAANATGRVECSADPLLLVRRVATGTEDQAIGTVDPDSTLLANTLEAEIEAGDLTPEEALARADELAEGYCSQVASAAFTACGHELEDDFWITMGQCINIGDEDERAECEEEADAAREETLEACDAQLAARQAACALVGEARYAPDFDPARFVDPDEIGGSIAANSYFPLVAGTQWVWEGAGEVITDTVTDRIKLIEGVKCRVLLDVVSEEGELVEITEDWYAQDVEGNVWYCGEIAQEFEHFEGDEPATPELVEIDGSFKAGRDGARPGILMPANPQPGSSHRQEVALGEAEDLAEIIRITGSESVPAADCVGNCVVAREFTPLEPGINETVYYAPDVGPILEITDEGERIALTAIHTGVDIDAVYAELPDWRRHLSDEAEDREILALASAEAKESALPAGRFTQAAEGAYCDQTAAAVLTACNAEMADDFWIGRGNCIDIDDDAERGACAQAAADALKEGQAECDEQYAARLELCERIGQERYDPAFIAANFVHPDEIGKSVEPNPYFPLIPGMRWVWQATFDEEGEQVTETITDRVTDEIKRVNGVPCRVLRDIVEVDGALIELTDDWYAQHLDGSVWYCGEIAQDFERFDGDQPGLPELVEIDGSFKAGRDGDKAGILMPAPADLQLGHTYRQEVSLGNAEDAAEIIALDGDEQVAVADCEAQCLVTREFTPIEPDVEARKYYAPGIGMILELEGEVRVELIEFSSAD